MAPYCALNKTGQTFISFAMIDAVNVDNYLDQFVFKREDSHCQYELTFSDSFGNGSQNGLLAPSNGTLPWKKPPSKLDNNLLSKLEEDTKEHTLRLADVKLLEPVILNKSHFLVKVISAILVSDPVHDDAGGQLNDKKHIAIAALSSQHAEHAGNNVSAVSNMKSSTRSSSSLCLNSTTSEWMRMSNATSLYRARRLTDRPSIAPSSYFSAWYPDPLDDTSDCVDEWGHVWTYGFHSPSIERHCWPSVSRIWRDEMGNMSPEGIKPLYYVRSVTDVVCQVKEKILKLDINKLLPTAIFSKSSL